MQLLKASQNIFLKQGETKIGIFDSGIGGFTILNALLKTRNDVEVFIQLIQEEFGNKSFKEIRYIAKEICFF